VASPGSGFAVGAGRPGNGKWRGQVLAERTPMNVESNAARDIEVVRDSYGFIITGASRGDLMAKLKTEYPGWRWK